MLHEPLNGDTAEALMTRGRGPAVPSVTTDPKLFEQIIPSNENITRTRSAVRRRGWFRGSAIARIGLFLVVGVIAVTYLYDRLMLKVSTDGVVSAPVTPIRAPIEGEVSLSKDVKPGGSIAKGSTLFSIVYDKADARVLLASKAKLLGLTDGTKQIDAQIASLTTIRSGLLQRGTSHRTATIARLESIVAETNAAIKGAQAKAALTARARTRMTDLNRQGFMSTSKTEQAVAEDLAANADVDRLKASLAKYNTEIGAAKKGIVIGEGYGDAPYSMQRADDLEMRIADLKTEKVKASLSERELRSQIASEERRLDQQTRDVITSSAAGVLWNIKVGEGTWVSRGEALADFVDCSQSFVEASLPDSGFETIHSGDHVKVLLSGADDEVAGVIRSVRGAAAETGSTYRAAEMEKQASGMMTVVVDVNSSALHANGCQLGRSAKVYFGKGGGTADASQISSLGEPGVKHN